MTWEFLAIHITSCVTCSRFVFPAANDHKCVSFSHVNITHYVINCFCGVDLVFLIDFYILVTCELSSLDYYLNEQSFNNLYGYFLSHLVLVMYSFCQKNILIFLNFYIYIILSKAKHHLNGLKK